MSKAFLREDAATEDDSEGPDSELIQLRNSPNYMTAECAKKMREEIRLLLEQVRPEVVRTVSWAASNGDRSENGDYLYGKKRLREIDRRIRHLQRRMDRAEIVDLRKQAENSKKAGHKVLFGARVGVKREDGSILQVMIVGIDEAEPSSGKISWISPMARALLGTTSGQTALLRTPKGEEELEILQVSYPES